MVGRKNVIKKTGVHAEAPDARDSKREKAA